MDHILCSVDSTDRYLIEKSFLSSKLKEKSTKNEPKAKEKRLESEPKVEERPMATKSVLKASVCALLNSHNGGKFKLKIDDGGEENKADRLIRTTEHHLETFLDSYTMNNNLGVCELTSEEITFEVEGLSSLCTLKYNIYLPTDAQVLPVKNEETVKKLLDVSRLEDVPETEANVPTKFVQGRSVGIPESKTVQFKRLSKAVKRSSGNDFGNRIISHDFTHCVSAFANYCGGLIFYGVGDDGIVRGTEIIEEDKQDLTKKISKYLNSADEQDQTETDTSNKMQWPDNIRPKKGVHWDILFKPVEDDDGKEIPSTYVIVIFVAPCPGGVFAKEPESYYIFDEEGGSSRVKPMTMDEWRKRRLLPPTQEKRKISSCRTRLVRLKQS